MGTSVLYLHGTDFSNKRNDLSKGPHAPDENAASWQLNSEQSHILSDFWLTGLM